MGSLTTGTKPSSQTDSTPGAFPDQAPAGALDNHSWLLQAMLDIQKSIGKIDAKTDALKDTIDTKTDALKEKVDSLASEVKSQKEKIDKLRLLVAAVGGGLAVVWTLAALVPQAVKEKIVHVLLG
ncbi:MAG: hypothetical protein WCJ64_18520 [Rhodospirillaceae bacterium]